MTLRIRCALPVRASLDERIALEGYVGLETRARCNRWTAVSFDPGR